MALSPLMQQYLDIKAQHQDHVLFYRVGDFYEMFFDDAVKISRELELTLTGKDCGLPERAPMCGIPYHAAETYIKRLIDRGYKVAICEQMEDPATAKGLVRRDVIRVVTPGTVIEDTLLNEERNNYIASIVIGGHSFGACFADISTGEVSLTQQKSTHLSMDIITELAKFSPSEVRFNAAMVSFPEIGDFLRDKLSCTCDLYEDSDLDPESCRKAVQEQFPEQTLDTLGLADKPEAVQALGGLIGYLNSTQQDGALRLTAVTLYRENQYMGIDITARRNLEITETMRSREKRGTLLWVLDKTKTAMGKRYIRRALEQPLMNLSEITRRQSAVRELMQNGELRQRLGALLSNVYDLERLMTRVMYGSINPREMKSLGFTLSYLPQLREYSAGFECAYLRDAADHIHALEDVCALIERAIVDEPPFAMKDGGVIRPGFHTELDELRDLCSGSKDTIAQIEQREKEKTGIKNLKIGYNRVFGYYIEVTNSNLAMVPDTYIRKQTLTNCERYITQELKDLETKVLTASEKILALESEIFGEVRQFAASHVTRIQETADAVARLDFVLSLANVAYDNGYVCPDITIDGTIRIKDGRHPVVEQMRSDTLFVPNDTLLDTGENKIMILTGPNMAGKSTYMRQVAILTIMAQIGSFVPAASASICLCDKIFTRVGASDDLSAGQSTFMVEMNEVAHILKNATPHSLVILDEIGRGTSTFDGMSIAKAVITYILQNKKLNCKTMFATHYHELTGMEQEYDGIKNYNIAVKKRGDDITFLRKIVRGGADESYGIEVAKLAGVPNAVVETARGFLASFLQAAPAAHLASGAPPADPVGESDSFAQMSFEQNRTDQLREQLRMLQIDTLTPIEALNKLYELKKLAE